MTTRAETEVHSRGFLPLGRLLPGVLALILAADVGLRLLPIDRFTFRAREAVNLYKDEGRLGPFAPNKRFSNPRGWGDLANLGNLPAYRERRLEVFTTNADGFRVGGPMFAGPPAAILVGDSFAICPGVPDDATLAAQIAHRWRRSVYNAAGLFPHRDLPAIREIAHRLQMREGLVIFEYMDRLEFPDPNPPRLEERPSLLAAPRAETVRWLQLSRIRILSERGYRELENGRILPNPYAKQVLQATLKDGKGILFLRNDSERTPRSVSTPVSYWSWLQRELAQENLNLLVVLVPDKLSVYGSLLASPLPESPSNYGNRLESALRQLGVPVLNLTGRFQSEARKAFAGGSYLYFLDDTHWNARGISVAADEIVTAVPNPTIPPAKDR